jgi:hypothetical protein
MPDQGIPGQVPNSDTRLFCPEAEPRLQQATSDLSWLLERHYALTESLQLVGNRYQLSDRQRLAVRRSACSDASLLYRREHEVTLEAVIGQSLLIDGYNLLTTVEVAMTGGIVIEGRDGCYRDIAGVHSTLRHVDSALQASRCVIEILEALGTQEVAWYFDSPVSNSGQLRHLLQKQAEECGCNCTVQVVLNPDPLLAQTKNIIVTADSIILDQCQKWFNLARIVLEKKIPEAHIVKMAN